MQTIQGDKVGRLSDSLERRSPEKGLRTSKVVDFADYRQGRPERSPVRSESPTPTGRKTAPSENTPPPNMLALQTIRNRQESQPPLADITNGPMPNGSSPFSLEALSSQILNITSIATHLQREMAGLSKRSKDNATDLVSLREATNCRDEDIRKSLRDLVSNLDQHLIPPESRLLGAPEGSRSTPNLALYLDDKAHNSTPRKNFTLPRIPSPSNFDRDITASPSLACVDGAASIALLEKVLREMATTDGQDEIVEILEEVRAQVMVKTPVASSPQSTFDPKMMAKLEEILFFMRQMQDESGSRALVRRPGDGTARSASHMDIHLDSEGRHQQLSKAKDADRRSSTMSAGSDIVNEDVMKMLKSVKQSLSQGGGLTNEVKALVRELRGEVLGMGREIAKKLESARSGPQNTSRELQGLERHEVSQIVDQALAELKEHMHQIVDENRKQVSAPTSAAVDTQEVVYAVRSALAEMPRNIDQDARDPVAEREEMLSAVREAWEDCKPEVALEHFGLERDEILEALKEGLKSHQPMQPTARDAGASYEEVLDAVRKGMADFKPPRIETEANITREELLSAVQEVLEKFDWPAPSLAPSSMLGSELSRKEVVDAVKEGLTHQAPVSKEIEFNREDLFDAIKSCLEGEQNPLGGMGERVVEAMHEFLGSMKNEFQQYSAANGKDTEQVLDALKDGLEDLRADIESYVDRATGVSAKEEIIDSVKSGIALMQADLDKGFSTQASTPSANTPELLDAMEKEFQHLRDTISKSMTPADQSLDKDEILDAIRDISDDRQSSLSSNSEDIVRLVKDELEHMRVALAGTLVKSGASLQRDDVFDAVREAMETNRSAPRGDGNESILSNTSELLDAFQDGVDNIRTDLQKVIDRPADLTSTYEILDTLKAGIEDVRGDISRLETQHQESVSSHPRDDAVVVHDGNSISTEIESLKVMITQLRIKVEALDSLSVPPASAPSEMRVHKDDLDELHTAIQGVHATVRDVRNAPAPEVVMPGNAASKDDIEALETLLGNMKARVEEMIMPDTDSIAKTVHLEAMEDLLRDVKASVEEISSKPSDTSENVDIELVELMLKGVQKSVDDIQSKLSGLNIEDGILSKTELGVVESLCHDINTQVAELGFLSPETLPSKDDIFDIRDSVKAFKEQIEADNELTAQAFEARKIEHGGIANKIDDVKNVIGDLRDELIGKLDGSEEGIIELNKVLGMHHDSMTTYATATSISELSELVRAEFGRQLDSHAATKGAFDEGSATLYSKHEESSIEIKTAMEHKFNELMAKYDDAQQANETKLGAFDERDKAHLEASSGTKAVVDDLKLLMDTLGSTVSETCDRMSDDAKTVFSKVDDASERISDLHAASALEHGQTRDEIARTLAAATRLEGSVAENQPALLAAIREVLDIVGQHYQHTQHQTESFAQATEEIKSGVRSIPESIPPLLPAPVAPSTPPQLIREVSAQEKYDDSQVHDKLNNLISHAASAKDVFVNFETHHKTTQDSLSNLGKLDEIHEKVISSAEEISAMVATQSRLMTEHHESRAAEATEAAIALEKRTAQKERVEADVAALAEEKNALIASMTGLREEQDELRVQTKRLTRDVAKLETALNIRQEEMRDMNSRAESLERRLFEGLMNQARTVKAGKSLHAKKITPAERDASMNLKRVPSTASTITTKTSIKDTASINNAVGTALKKRAPLGLSRNSTVSSRGSNVDRRILSTSHVTGNRGRDVPERALILAPAPKAGGFGNLKRSHSVKSNPSAYGVGRKPSWSGVMTTVSDKENFGETENLDGDAHEEDVSDTGTERRTSVGTGYMYTDSMTYGTGSELSSASRTSDGRSVSYASSIGGTLNGQTESIAEEDEDEEDLPSPGLDDDMEQPTLTLADPSAASTVDAGQDNALTLATMDSIETTIPAHIETTVPVHGVDAHDYADDGLDNFSDLQPPPLIMPSGGKYDGLHASDSGLGTEPPTATEEHPHGEAEEYFQMTAADHQGLQT